MADLRVSEEGASLGAQVYEPMMKECRSRFFAHLHSGGSWGGGEPKQLLSSATEAASLRGWCIDPTAALLSVQGVVQAMEDSDDLRYGEMVKCQEIAKRLPKASKDAATHFKKQADRFNKVRKASKLKVGVSAGLPKLGLGWLDDEKNASHMSEADMREFPDNFEKMLEEMASDPELVQLAAGSRKPLEEFLKVVLLQPVLKDVHMNMSLNGLLAVHYGQVFDPASAKHSEFLEVWKHALFVKMKLRAGKSKKL